MMVEQVQSRLVSDQSGAAGRQVSVAPVENTTVVSTEREIFGTDPDGFASLTTRALSLIDELTRSTMAKFKPRICLFARDPRNGHT